ncbi:MAG: nickel-responsive transcriptional regulator NikR [Candidatus Omnitrophica bacterium]|nr:nickel-responsive transcriptional regulator NikR [Candidatus Omnitrophota bacterium]
MSVTRFSISIEKELVKEFDRYLKAKGYSNRSEAIRDLLRRVIVEEEWEKGEFVYAGITLVYDHTQREVVDKVTDIQHEFHKNIISSQHVHIDEKNCLEIIAVKGRAEEIKKLYNRLEKEKKIKHIAIARSTTGRRIT